MVIHFDRLVKGAPGLMTYDSWLRAAHALTSDLGPRTSDFGVRVPRAGLTLSAYGSLKRIRGIVPISPPRHEQDPMLDESQQQAIVTRLNRIEGQVKGIRRMV